MVSFPTVISKKGNISRDSLVCGSTPGFFHLTYTDLFLRISVSCVSFRVGYKGKQCRAYNSKGKDV